MKNIESIFRHLRLFGIVYLCVCTLLVGFSVWKAYSFAEAQREKIYVLDEGKSLMLALSQDLEQNRPVEAREHVRRFHELFFTLSPDKNAIEGNIRRAMFLSDRSAYAHYVDLAEQGYYNRIISGNVNQRVGIDSVKCQAPGRVNLIGEHTDYNDGFVLPCAIDYQTVISCAPRDDRKVRVMAADYENQLDEFSLDAPIVAHENYQWANYVRGVVKHLQLRNNSFGGVDMVISGNVPQGAGLSSSASLEVAVGTVLQQLYHLPLDGAQIALNGQEAENQFVGCNCGIMDQLISALGKKDHALLIDCRSLGTKAVSMPKGVAVVIINSNFKRTLVGSEYNTRREQCETGARFFQQPALRDVTIEEFNAVAQRFEAKDR